MDRPQAYFSEDFFVELSRATASRSRKPPEFDRKSIENRSKSIKIDRHRPSSGAFEQRTVIADAPAVIVTTPQRQFAFLMRFARD